MGGFGRSFGYVNNGILPPDIGFDQGWSDDDWYHSKWGLFLQTNYTPLNSSVIQQAQTNWANLKELAAQGTTSSAAAQARLDDLKTQLTQVVQQIDSLTSHYGPGYAPPYDAIRVTNYNTLNALLTGLANDKWPDAVTESIADQAAVVAADAKTKAAADAITAAKAKVQAAAATAAAKVTQTQDDIVAAQQAISTAQAATAAANSSAAAHQLAAKQAADAHAATIQGVKTPLLVAAVAIPLAVVAVFALKGSSTKSLAGYRRRRRAR